MEDDRAQTRLPEGRGADWAPIGGSYSAIGSARPRWSRAARLCVFALGVLGLAGAMLASAGPVGIGVAGLLWTQAALKSVGLFMRPRSAAPASDVGVHAPSRGAPGRVEETGWPRYTVLVPLYREAAALPRLILALAALDYPRDRLEILLVCEADDALTLDAMPGLFPPFRLVRVPPGGPRTKPKALRVAMQEARGQIVTIYDAEDVPHPGQLKQAARALLADPELAAVQAPLRVDNLRARWITRQFALEYAGLFFLWFPTLASLGLPAPLGGTSNHIRRDALERAGGWDPFNVTEDADLSFRLALDGAWNGAHVGRRIGRRIGWINLPTDEEAVASLRAWHHQRTRWFKGYAQTWWMHTRRPCGGWARGGWRRGGWRRWVAVQITVGLSLLCALLHLPTVAVLGFKLAVGAPVPGAVLAAGAAFYLSGIAVSVRGALRAGVTLRVGDLLGVPLYWLLLTGAAWAGMLDLARRPVYWAKTTHGVAPRAPFPELRPFPLSRTRLRSTTSKSRLRVFS